MPIRFLICAVLMFLVSGCANLAPTYDAIVSQQLAKTQTLAKRTYLTVQAALDEAPSAGKKPYRIFINTGEYYEKIIIAKPNVQLIGADKTTTRLYYDAYAGQQSTEPGATRGQIWGTPGSATIIVRAADVRIENLTIENSFDFLRNDALPNDHPQRISNTQAVALHLDNGSDRFLARSIRLLGFQDTLYVNAGRSWFDKSLIAGNVDFIFGKGRALFTQSEIKTLRRGKPSTPHGYITAPSTSITSDYGLTFIDCMLTRDQSVPDNSTALGRPWHPTTQFSDGRYADPEAIGKTVFINTWMDAHIARNGWHSMGGTAKDGSKIQFQPEDARFFEYRSKGPGAAVNSKRRQVPPEQVPKYTFEKIFAD